MKEGAATLLIKVKAHRGDPVNEEADIRAEMGRLKKDDEKTWSTQTDRTIYQWSELSNKLLKPSKGEWRNDSENTPNGKKRTLHRKKTGRPDQTLWRVRRNVLFNGG